MLSIPLRVLIETVGSGVGSVLVLSALSTSIERWDHAKFLQLRLLVPVA